MSAASKVGLIAICLGGIVAASTAGPQAPKKLLFLTHAGLYKHTSLGPAERAVASWGPDAGYELTTLQGYLQEREELDLSIITVEYLAQFDGVMMMTNGNLPMRDEQKRALYRDGFVVLKGIVPREMTHRADSHHSICCRAEARADFHRATPGCVIDSAR